MTTLVCFDPHAGTLKRYVSGAAKPTGQAFLGPWLELPEQERVVSLADIEAFRTGHSVGGRAPKVAA